MGRQKRESQSLPEMAVIFEFAVSEIQSCCLLLLLISRISFSLSYLLAETKQKYRTTVIKDNTNLAL